MEKSTYRKHLPRGPMLWKINVVWSPPVPPLPCKHDHIFNHFFYIPLHISTSVFFGFKKRQHANTRRPCVVSRWSLSYFPRKVWWSKANISSFVSALNRVTEMAVRPAYDSHNLFLKFLKMGKQRWTIFLNDLSLKLRLIQNKIQFNSWLSGFYLYFPMLTNGSSLVQNVW